ncbi:MAG: InlB B-repeat-containing protein [Clostridia bacterium]|nr:InlB B-repeat-containing protein [Clostridia bacterium]
MKKIGKRILSTILAVATIMSCWVWMAPEQSEAAAATTDAKDHYLFAYFTGTSKEGQTIHLAVSEDGYNFTALRNNEPILIPSKGVGNVRDPYIWYNEQDHYYYIIATDLDFTDGGGDYYNRWAMNEDTDYSDNSQSFLIWRSRDLINWYDEVMIDVAAMSHLIGDTSRMTQVWAPQVLWDGTSYIVYFTLCCEQTKIDGSTRHDWTPAKDGEDNGRNMEIVYLRTSDLLDRDAYYEYGVLYDNPAKNTIDADIIYNEKNGKYYLFYKNEDGYDPENVQQIYDKILTRDWKSVHYLVGDSPTGPFTKPAASHDDYGFRVFDGISERLEGGNGFFDNEGHLVVYADAYDKGDAYFYVARSKNDSFTEWDYINESNKGSYGISTFNINSLSPRHGSVVKITVDEYNRLLDNAYSIKSSSFPMGENLEDHLVGRFFTTTNALENAVEGKPNLDSANGITMEKRSDTGEYCAKFSTTQYASIDLEKLFTEDLNYDDGFTITFKAMANSRTDGNHQKIFDIADVFGKRTGAESYINFSTGDGTAAYLDSYYGPGNTKAGLGTDVHSWANDDNTNRTDGKWHEYLISSANGNLLVYIDGKLAMSRNRFTTGQRPNKYSDKENFSDRVLQVPVRYTDEWYKVIGNSTINIGKSGWNDPYFQGSITNFCIYDCSMSYYDIETVTNAQENAAGIKPDTVTTYSTFSSAIPSFTHSSTSQMASLEGKNFSNILYSPQYTDLPDGTDNPNGTFALAPFEDNGFYFALYYAKNTVLFVDGASTPKLPVFAGLRVKNKRDADVTQIYPIVHQTNDKSDSKIFSLVNRWHGWHNSSKFHESINNPDGITTGHNSTTSGACDLDNSDNELWYIGNTLSLNTNAVTFNNGYQKVILSWHLTYDWQEKGTWGWKDWQTNRTKDFYVKDAPIWVIDLRPYVTLRNTAVSEYVTYVTKQNVCPGSIAAYKAVVEEIMKFNPHNYSYSSGTETAVKACAAQIAKLKQDYADAKSKIAPCNSTVMPGKAPTCAANGVTEGKYCTNCGTVSVVQEPITKLPHDFGDTTITELATIQCKNCDYSYMVQECEVRYGNLFNLSKFMFTNSAGVTNNLGKVNIDTQKDTITFRSVAESGEAITNASNGTGRDTTHGNYAIPVDGGETYVLEYLLASTGVDTDVYIFCYDVENKCVANTYGKYCSDSSGKPGKYTYGITVPESTCYVELRFDVDTPGGTAIFSNIGFYKKESYDLYATENPYARLGFLTGESKELYIPKKTGYNFLGWYTSNGRKIENTNQLNCTETVFPRWEKLGYSVNYNGNLFSLTDFAKTNDYNMQGGNPDAHVWADFEDGVFHTLSAREGVYRADLNEAQNLDAYNTPGSYKVPVTAGQEYVYTMTLANKQAYQCYLWFYDSSGRGVTFPGMSSSWINHGTNVATAKATWEGNTLVIRFTAPQGATHISFRMGTTGKAGFVQSFSDIGLYTVKDYEIMKDAVNCPATVYVPAGETVTLATPTRDGFTFRGWKTGQFGTGSDFTSTNTSSLSASAKIYPVWQINNLALTKDSYALDFDTSITFDPLDNDAIAKNEAEYTGGSYVLKSVTSSNAKGTFVINDDNTVTYTPAIGENATIDYTATLDAYGLKTEVTGKITTVLASNILYEDNVFKVSATDTGKEWTLGTQDTVTQALPSAADVYGFDPMYANANTYSNGSVKQVTVNAGNKTSQKLTFKFTGTGFTLNGACGSDTGVQVIAVRDGNNNLVKSAVVDTYYSDTYGTLYQAPVYNVSGLTHGTYTVEVTAAYLPSISGAVKNDSSTFSSMSANDNDLEAALADLGLDYILEADDVDVEWFDDNSVLNGGTGAYDPESFSTQGVTELKNYVDSIRVFEPVQNADEHYIDSEKNARYYNIADMLLTKEGFLQGSNGFIYIEGKNGVFNAEDYKKSGSKHEVYLAGTTNASEALTFKVEGYSADSRVMISARAAYGVPNIKLGAERVDTIITPKTEMYYDITDFVAADGTVTIQNVTAGSLLAIGYLKLTGETSLQAMSDLSTTIDMIEAPIEGEITASGSITNVEYTPSTDSHNSFNVTVNGRPTMIQFIEMDGGTRTYDRNNKNVVIKSYNADGVEVNSLDRTVAYEVWTINTNLTGPDVKVRAKYISDGAYKWENECYSFTYEILEPEYDAEIREITPAAASGKKGAVSVKVVTGPDAQGIRFVMPDGSTCTYYAANAVQLENGNLEFTGNAWMNEDGLNSISVNVKVNGVWKDLGAFDYTVE